jgi:hypothetical protein
MIQHTVLDDVQREYELHLAQVREKFRGDLREFISRLIDTALGLSHEVEAVPSHEMAPVIYRVLCDLQKDFLRVWDLYVSYLRGDREEEAR